MKITGGCVFLGAILVSVLVCLATSQRPVQSCNEVCTNNPSAVGDCCRAHHFTGGSCSKTACSYASPCAMCDGSPNRMKRGSQMEACNVICANRIGGDIIACCKAHGYNDGDCSYSTANCFD